MATAPSATLHPVFERLLPLGRAEDFATLRALLEQCGYTTEALCQRLGISGIFEYKSLREDDCLTMDRPLDVLIRLLADGGYVERQAAQSVLPPGALELMEALGVVAFETAQPDLCYATVTLLSWHGLLLMSDRSTAPDRSKVVLTADVVYPAVVVNTRDFLDILPETPCEAFLDIGTGTGVAALAASGYARHAWGTDIAARSVRFAECNRRLNGAGNVTMLEGDMYQPVEGLTFDRIVTHPPYVPARENTVIFRDGGDDGEQILRRAIEGLPRFLRPGGRFYCLVTAADCEGQMFEDRIRLWLGADESRFDLVLVSHTLTTPRDLNANSFQGRNTSVTDLLYRQELWARRKVQFLFYGTVLIRRQESAHPAFTIRVQRGEGYTARHIDWLLDWETEVADPAGCDRILDLRPALSPDSQLGVFHRVRDGRFVPVGFSLRSSRPFDTECVAEQWLVQVIAHCDGQITWREHFEKARRAGAVDPATTAREFAAVLGSMVANGILQIAEKPFPPS